MDGWFGDSGVGAQQSQIMHNRMNGPQTVYCLFTTGYDAVCGFPGCAPSVQCRVDEFPARLNGIITPQYIQQLKDRVNTVLSRHIVPQIPWQFCIMETRRDSELRLVFRQANTLLPQGYQWEYNGLDSLRWSFVANLNVHNVVVTPMATAVAEEYQMPIAVVVQEDHGKKY